MILVDDVYQIIRNLLRKNQQGYLTPGEFNRYAKVANKARFNEIYGRLQEMQAGKPVRSAYDQNQQTDEKLSVFLQVSSPTVDSTTGQVDKPDGLLRLDSITHSIQAGPQTGKIVKVRRATKDQEADWASSDVMPPTEEYPFYVDYGTFYQVYPKSIGPIKINALTSPIDPVWAYTLDGSGRAIYNPGSSINFQFEDAEIGNIISKILVYAGKAVEDGQAVQLGAQLEVKGQ